MSTTTTLTIDYDKNCKSCGKPGAMPNGLCLACVAKRLKNITKEKNMSKKTEKPKSSKRPKNQDLPGVTGEGVTPERIPELDKLADDGVDILDELEELKNRKATLFIALTDEMHSHGLLVYHSESGVDVKTETGKETLKLTRSTIQCSTESASVGGEVV